MTGQPTHPKPARVVALEIVDAFEDVDEDPTFWEDEQDRADAGPDV